MDNNQGFVRYIEGGAEKSIAISEISAADWNKDEGILVITIGDPQGECTDYYLRGEAARNAVDALRKASVL